MLIHGDEQPGLNVSLPDTVSVPWFSLEDFLSMPIGELTLRNELGSLRFPQSCAVEPEQCLIKSPRSVGLLRDKDRQLRVDRERAEIEYSVVQDAQRHSIRLHIRAARLMPLDVRCFQRNRL